MDICQARYSIFLATAAAPPLPFSRGESTASPEDERVVGRGEREKEREREAPPPPLFRDFRETLIHQRQPGSPRRTHSRSMGSVMSSGGSPSKGNAALSPVMLNVYDLTPLNNYVRWLGIGIFHSGIEVHELEYGFGAHDFPTSGVFEVEPKTCPGFLYRCSILLGHTSMPPSEFQAFIESIATEYHGDTYHLISKNCNHFTDDVSERLTGRPIPRWVNRLAGLGAICNCLLPESLRLPAVKQIAEYQGLSEDGSEFLSVITATTHDPLESDDADQEKYLFLRSGGEQLTIMKSVPK
ncbi:unnamed protein product [Musa hybrid cultivar]